MQVLLGNLVKTFTLIYLELGNLSDHIFGKLKIGILAHKHVGVVPKPDQYIVIELMDLL